MDASGKIMPTNRLLGLMVVILILAIVGPVAIFIVFLEMFILLIIELIHISDNIQVVQENRQLAKVRKRAVKDEMMRELKRNAAVAETKMTEAETRAVEAMKIAEEAKKGELKASQRAQKAEKGAAKAEEMAESMKERLEELDTKLKEAEDIVAEARRGAEEAERRASELAKTAIIDINGRNRSDCTNLSVEGQQANDSPYIAPIPKSLTAIHPLEDGFTCIGKTLKGARCRQWMFKKNDREDANKRLRRMQSGDPGDSFEYSELLALAKLMLCPRWHRDIKPQGPGIASGWYAELTSARASLSISKETKKFIARTPSNKLRTPPYLLSSGASSSASVRSGRSSIAISEDSSSILDTSSPSSAGSLFGQRKPSRTRIGDPVMALTPTFRAIRYQQT
jgi:hypothetical protein